MKSTRIWIGVGMLVALMAMVAVAHSVRAPEMRDYGMFGGGRHMMHFFSNYLDLTDAQQQQVKEILAKDKPALQPLMQQMQQNRQQMRQVIESATFDETRARALAAQQSQTMTELTVQKAHMFSDLYQVLTPDQKTKLDQFLDRHEQRFAQHMNDATKNQ
jgi:protein CpxP